MDKNVMVDRGQRPHRDKTERCPIHPKFRKPRGTQWNAFPNSQPIYREQIIGTYMECYMTDYNFLKEFMLH